jgi:hypothetical protein
MTPKQPTPKQKVQRKCPKAWAYPTGDVLCVPWRIWKPGHKTQFGTPLGEGNTADEAWADAAKNLGL